MALAVPIGLSLRGGSQALVPASARTVGKRPLKAAYHIRGFREIFGMPEVLGLMSTSASGHYSSLQAGSWNIEFS